jgi:hypothetical protein
MVVVMTCHTLGPLEGEEMGCQSVVVEIDSNSGGAVVVAVWWILTVWTWTWTWTMTWCVAPIVNPFENENGEIYKLAMIDDEDQEEDEDPCVQAARIFVDLVKCPCEEMTGRTWPIQNAAVVVVVVVAPFEEIISVITAAAIPKTSLPMTLRSVLSTTLVATLPVAVAVVVLVVNNADEDEDAEKTILIDDEDRIMMLTTWCVCAVLETTTTVTTSVKDLIWYGEEEEEEVSKE